MSISLAAATALGGTLKIDPSQTVHSTNRRNLTGSNIALWNQPWELADSELHDYVRELAPAFIRIPGGSWANHYIWNGNGVRSGDSFDLSKLKDGVWDIDWSGYAPGFNIEGDERKPVSDSFHGSWDVRQLHDFVEDFGAQAIVTVNLGSGTPEMASEWVRWANMKNGYNVKYWEIGNELEGRWELGHILPDGREMTGEIYAQRFREFAEAMKAVDPTIKTGGPASSNDKGAFIKETLRDAGDLVDFVSFHTYPVKNRQKTEAEFFDGALTLEPALERIHSWIAQYQPDRKNEIEVAITEWNSKVVEARDTADLMNGLWATIWIGEMFRNGVSFANQWDMITATETGGHGLFYFDPFDFEQPGVPQAEMDRQFESFNPPCIPKAQYWALWLWSQCMGDELIQSTLTEAENLYSAVTRSDDGLQILLVNTSREHAAPVQLKSTETLSDHATAIQVSHREYFWNPITHRPQWSRKPEPVPLDISNGVTVPPFSALVLQVPNIGNENIAGQASLYPENLCGNTRSRIREACPTNHIALLIPKTTPEDIPVEAWVLAPDTAACSANQEARFVELTVKGPATLNTEKVRINEGAGRFTITPTGTGTVTVCAGQAEVSMRSEPVESRTEILWAFEDDTLDGIQSDFALSLSDTAKPNQQTAAIRLDAALPKPQHDTLLKFEPIPNRVSKERVGGVTFEVRASHDLATDDPYASLQIVLQSESDHWIPVGSVPLNRLTDEWQTLSFKIKNHEHLPAMKWLYSIRVQLSSTQPIHGEIFINDAGLILR
ncbi:GH39 family glycosyl hydrolase [Tichowtungia aerotolerans]|uniref:Alpha-L-arabinofuranosidase 1 catalytic domain-containing protein n=1 Tax=Tichowtungia aerotolerans TaxID=2697043 RepID=A0A6P1M4W2_9BACT|nr:glycoside hydrolase family 44 protein [Tichowtungia aerotolerans]QHI69092.1 hypothetical protein GT409_06405 [Tichowtungia aerotolerans]